MRSRIMDEFTNLHVCEKTKYVLRKNRDGKCGKGGCNAPIDRELPYRYCDKHRIQHNAEETRRVQDRLSKGLCVICGAPQSVGNKRLCPLHRAEDIIRKKRERREKYVNERN